MDQEKGAGHHIITKVAVERLFASGRARDGKILGMSQDDFFHILDGDQEYIDRWYGPTVLPFWMDEAAQKQHGLADPNLSTEENVTQIRNWIEDNTAQGALLAAQQNIGQAMQKLGAAVHALEDTYSEAHMWRGVSEHFGVETAEIQQIMVFDPSGLSKGGGVISNMVLKLKGASEGTHDAWFDKVPLDKRGDMVEGDDKAATNAITRLLDTFFAAYDNTTGSAGAEGPQAESLGHMDSTMAQIEQIVSNGIAPMLKVAQNAKVAASPDAAGWAGERDQRKAADQAEIDAGNATRAPDIEFDGALEFDPAPPSAGRSVTLKWREVNKGGSCPSYAVKISWTDGGGSHETTVSDLSLEQNDSRERSHPVDLADGAATCQFTLTTEVPGAAGGAQLTASVDAQGS
jgi:hypothetical protein